MQMSCSRAKMKVRHRIILVVVRVQLRYLEIPLDVFLPNQIEPMER